MKIRGSIKRKWAMLVSLCIACLVFSAYRVNASGPLAPSLTETETTHLYIVSCRYVFIVDVSIPSQARLLGTFQTQNERCLNSIAVLGTYAYVVSAFTGLTVLDISDPAHPKEVNFIESLPGYTIRIHGRTAFIANLGEVYSVDLTAPTEPKLVTTYDVGGFTTDLEFSAPYLYVGAKPYYASDKPTVRIIDTRANEAVATSTSLRADQLFVSDGYLYTGYEYNAGMMTRLDLKKSSIENPIAPAAPINLGYATDTGVGDIYVAEPYVFVTSRWGMYRIDSNSSSSPQWELPHYLTGMIRGKDNTLYISHGLNIYMFDMSDPLALQPIGSYVTPPNNSQYGLGDVVVHVPNASMSDYADLAISQSIEVTSDKSPYLPDQLTLAVTVTNLSSSVTVPNARVAFIFGKSGEADADMIDSPWIGEVGPNESRTVHTQWYLHGNIENRSISAQITDIEQVVDPNEDNNITSQDISVYYVDFRHYDDAYSFLNNVQVLQYTSNDLWDDIYHTVQELDLPEISLPPLILLGRLIENRSQGYCFGMSATSILYKIDSNLKPFDKSTYDMPIDVALPYIKQYQRWQIWDLISLVLFDFSTPDSVYQDTVERIKSGKPVLHGIKDTINGGGHAVVAYKAVTLDDKRLVFYYDPNRPLQYLDKLGYATYGTFSNDTYRYPGEFFGHPELEMNEVHVLEPSVRDRHRIDTLMRQQAEYIQILAQGGEEVVMLRLPYQEEVALSASIDETSITVEDTDGRISGIANGGVVNQIPATTVETVGSFIFITLPRTDNIYKVRVSGQTGTVVSLYALLPTGPATARSLGYSDIELKTGSPASVDISPSNQNTFLNDGSDLHSPSFDGQLSGNELFLPLLSR